MTVILRAKRGPLTGVVMHNGPIRASVFVKGLAPRTIMVPVEAMPLGFEKGDEVEVVIRAKDGDGKER